MGFSYLSPYRFDKGVSYINVATALLTYNLTSTETLPSWLSLSRMSTATRFNSTGTLVDSAIDTPRFDYGYDGTNWINQGLLVEKQSTNQNYHSNNFYAPNWSSGNGVAPGCVLTKTGITISGLDQWQIDSTRSGGDRIEKSNGFQNYVGTTYSIVVSKLTYDFVSAASVNNAITTLDFRTLTASNNGVVRQMGSLVRFGKAFASNNNNISVMPATTGVNSKESALVYFAQAETLSYMSSLIKTSGTAATRSQDNLQLNLSNYTGSIKLTYKRQDTEVVETKWVDLTNSSNPNLSDYLDVRGLVIRN